MLGQWCGSVILSQPRYALSRHSSSHSGSLLARRDEPDDVLVQALGRDVSDVDVGDEAVLVFLVDQGLDCGAHDVLRGTSRVFAGRRSRSGCARAESTSASRHLRQEPRLGRTDLREPLRHRLNRTVVLRRACAAPPTVPRPCTPRRPAPAPPPPSRSSAARLDQFGLEPGGELREMGIAGVPPPPLGPRAPRPDRASAVRALLVAPRERAPRQRTVRRYENAGAPTPRRGRS